MSLLYLVDDHPVVREGLRSVLESAGHRIVGEAEDPVLALAEIERLRPEVILLDMHLGHHHSGLELLNTLRRRELPLRVIVLTMSAQPRHVAEALKLGADGYVLKGSPARDVCEAVEAVMAGRRHLGPSVADLAVQALAEDSGGDPMAVLSPRERQIVVLVVKGQTSASIGEQLHLSPKTVDTYRSRLMAKLGVDDVPALVRWAIRAGVIDANER